MVRFLLVFTVQTALALASVPAAAQQSGGETLAPEVLNTPGAAEIVVERAVARLQLFQSLQAIRGGGLQSGTAVASPSAANAGPDRSAVNQQAVANVPTRGDAGFLAGFSGGRALASSRASPRFAETARPTIIDQSKRLVINAVGSPISIGNGNIVQQQVANSTAIGAGASANASARNGVDHSPSGGTAHKQSATSSAVNLVPGGPDAAGSSSGRGAQR